MLDASDSSDRKQLEKIIKTMERYPDAEVLKLKKAGPKREKIKNGEVFQCEIKDGWKAGVFVSDKLFTVTYRVGVHTKKRIEQLKFRGVARLLDIAKRGWAPVAQRSWLPQKYVNVKTGKALYTSKATEAELEDARRETADVDPGYHAE